MVLIAEEDRARVAHAITEAETTTSGEIVAVIAAESDSHLWLPFLVASAVALLVPWPLIYLTWVAVQWIFLAQLLVFAALVVVFWWRPLRFAVLPRALKNRTAHRRAVEQFLAQNMHTTDGRTGVLIFVSVAERYAEIIADTAIHEKVDAATWQAIVDRLTAQIASEKAANGFIEAVTAVGALLASHYPPGSDLKGALPDRLIVLE